MDLAQAILESLREHTTKVLCRDSQGGLTGEQVLTAGRSVAMYSATLTGRTVGILLPNCALYPVAIFGVLSAGKIPVLLNPLLKPEELNFITNEASIETVIVARQTESSIAGLQLNRIDVREITKPSAH